MQEERYNNYAQAIGKVTSLALKDIGDRKEALGKMTLSCNGNLINVDFWNPQKATTNHVARLFTKLREGQIVRVGGELVENEYEDNIYRNLQAYVSAKNGVSSRSFEIYHEEEEVEQKATLKLEGDVLDLNVDYSEGGDNVDLTAVIVTFNQYNRDNPDKDLSVQRVIKNTIDNYANYVEDRDISGVDINSLNTLAERIKEEPTKANALTVLKEFIRDYDARMFQINTLTVKAYNEIADKIVNNIELGDNISTGVMIYNKAKTDEFGYSEGSISELRLKKIVNVNKKIDGKVEGDTPLGNVQDEVDDLEW